MPADPRRLHRLPDGTTTDDRDRWAATWVALGKSIEPFFPGYEAVGFDPNLEFVTHVDTAGNPRPFASSLTLTPAQAQLLLAYASTHPPLERGVTPSPIEPTPMPQPTAPASIPEIVERFQRDIIACVIGHVTELLAPLAPVATVAPAALTPPVAPSQPTVREVVALGRDLARGPAAALPTAEPPKTPSDAHRGLKPANAKRARGEKRPKAVLAALTEVLATYITKHPGQRIEQIGPALKETTADLKRPMDRLIAAKRVRTTGSRRATRYFPVAKK